METLTKKLILACAFAGLCGQSNAMEHKRPLEQSDSDSEESESKRPRFDRDQTADAASEFGATEDTILGDILHGDDFQAEAAPEAAASSQSMILDNNNDAENNTTDDRLGSDSLGSGDIFTTVNSSDILHAIDNNDRATLHNILSNYRGNPDAETDDISALMNAVMDQNPEMVEMLIHANANVNKANDDGTTPLIEAAGLRSLEIVQKLINAHANLNTQCDSGFTALIRAARDNNSNNAQALIAAGANVNIQDNNGLTPLMYAVRNNNIALVQTLIAAGADVNTQNIHGETALMWAAGFVNDAAVDIFLSRNKAGELLYGTETLVRDDSGRTALEWAQQKGRHTCAMSHRVLKIARQDEIIKKLTLQQEQERAQIKENMQTAEDDWSSCPLDVLRDVIRPFIDPEHRDNN